jgi:hypothetical protein
LDKSEQASETGAD